MSKGMHTYGQMASIAIKKACGYALGGLLICIGITVLVCAVVGERGVTSKGSNVQPLAQDESAHSRRWTVPSDETAPLVSPYR